MRTFAIVMRKLSLIILSLTLTLAIQAQEHRNLHERAEQLRERIDSLRHEVRSRADSVQAIRLMDSLLDLRDQRARQHYDTLYIAKPQERWTVKVRGNVTGNHLLLRGTSDGQTLRTDLEAAHKATLSFSVGYRGLVLGFALNPLKWAGKNKDFEYNMLSYGRKFGFDVAYVTSNTFAGTSELGNTKSNVEAGNVGQRLLNLNAYYVFNHRRFSYPAAFSQSQIQLRSAGSWLLGASVNGGKVTATDDAVNALTYNKMRYVNIGLGGGYGYNLVLGRWLIHGSCISELVVANYSRMEMDEGRVKMPYRFPNFIVQGRVAALYNWKKSFVGVTGVSNFSSMGTEKQLDVLQVKWMARVFYGFRF